MKTPPFGAFSRATGQAARDRRRGSTPAIVVAILLALVLTGVGLTCLYSLGNRTTVADRAPGPIRADADPAPKRAIPASTLLQPPTQPSVGSAEIDPGIDALIDEIAQAIRDGDGDRFGRCFDAQRLYREMQADGGLTNVGRQDEDAFVAGLGQGIGRTIDQYRDQAWHRHAVQQVRPLENPGEVLVYVRGTTEEGVSIRNRWWLTNTGGQWRVYDMEDLDVGLRLTTVTCIAANGRWLEELQELLVARRLLVEGDVDQAHHALLALDDAAFPDSIEALRLMMIATALAGQGRNPDAIEHIDRAEQLNHDMPALDYLRAVVHNALGAHEAALEAAERYVSLLGPGPAVLLEIGDAHHGLGQHERAAAAYRDALDHDPNCLDCLYGLAVLPDEPALVRFGRFADVNDAMVAFEALAIALLEGDRPDLVEALVEVHRESHPDDPNLGYYLGLVRASAQQFHEAEAVLREALPRAPETERQVYRDALWDVMVAGGRTITAYRESTDPAAAFFYLADVLWWRNDLDTLRELVEAHRRVAPGDLWTQFYTGEVRTIEGDHRAAAAAYTAARDAAADPETRQRFASQVVGALYRSGQLMEAYRALPSRRHSARKLAGYCRRDGNVDGLKQLITAHRSEEPDDPIPALWQADIYWFQHDLDAVVRQLEQHAETLAADGEAMAVYDDRMVRALLRLERHEEALLAATTSTARDGDPFYEVVVHAAAGAVEPATTSMRACLELGYDQSMFFEDQDAGPALATPAFHSLRAGLR